METTRSIHGLFDTASRVTIGSNESKEAQTNPFNNENRRAFARRAHKSSSLQTETDRQTGPTLWKRTRDSAPSFHLIDSSFDRVVQFCKHDSAEPTTSAAAAATI